MIQKILIANRGEIALRVVRTAKKLGIKTVAVYSEADTNALHVSQCDEAVFIGPSPANQSYLVIENIVRAAQQTGADAVFPGYGFLSENAKFAEALKAENITFIGPSSKAIRVMGDKISAKKLAEKAKVNTVPGYMGVIKTPKDAQRIAGRIGYPVMVKAAAGGGGKGMRIVRKKEEMEQAFKSAMNEARNSFKDDRIFIEKFIENPRHIEIQVMADSKGNVVCLGERECSIQRQHQKVIEEAPSPFLDEKTRKKMYEQSAALAKKVQYTTAGTVEYIMDQNRNFYFLEMNTRLQVEHPVTEMITGMDLVEEMIRIAEGKPLSVSQEEVKLNGWSMECRVYAEDPSRGFLPSTGRITEYDEPDTNGKVRIDTGVYAGCEISMFYDAMISKVITHADTRIEAIERMQSTLGAYNLRGIAHNMSFLEAILAHPRFQEGNLSTNFIEEEYPDGFSGADLTEEVSRTFVAVAALIYLRDANRAKTISGQTKGRERQIGTRWVVTIDDVSYPVYAVPKQNGYEITTNQDRFSIESAWTPGSSLLHGHIDGRTVHVGIELLPSAYRLEHGGSKVKATVRSPRVAELDKHMPKQTESAADRALMAPISGRVVEILVKEGDTIKKGSEVLILEAMKMENMFYAERDCVVKKIVTEPGANVQVNEILIEFDPIEAPKEAPKDE